MQTTSDWKHRVNALLIERDATAVMARFSGGNDEGGLDEVTLTLADGTTVDIMQHYDTNHQMVDGRWVMIKKLLTPADHADNLLYDIVGEPVFAEYGSFAGEYSTSGVVGFDRNTGREIIEDHYEADRYDDDEDEDE